MLKNLHKGVTWSELHGVEEGKGLGLDSQGAAAMLNVIPRMINQGHCGGNRGSG